MMKSAYITAAAVLSLALLAGPVIGQQQGGSQKKQEGQKQEKQVSGKIQRQKDVTVKGTTVKNKVVLLRTADNRLIAVDLGPTEKLKDVDLAVDKDVIAWGRIKRVGDRPVLFATRLEAGNKTIDVDRKAATSAAQQTQQPKQVTGTIMQEKEVTVKGTGDKNRVVLLKTDKGRNLVVDLGSTRNLKNVQIKKGEQITVSGKPVRIGQRLILLASDVSAGGTTQQIQRPRTQQGSAQRGSR